MAHVDVREIDADGWSSIRDVRLAALREAPHAFASTYEHEVEFSEQDWLRQFTNRGNFLAYAAELGEAPVGMVGCFSLEPGTTELLSMWVRPQARGLGVGSTLVEAVVRWARAHGHDRVHLWVAEGNDMARRLYQRCGFTPTGERQPLPSNPEIPEIAMARDA
jgi:ribosomal protein S18 acetylase RimI-like enzyme